MFQYKLIHPVEDPALNTANGNLDNALTTLNRQNRVLEENVSTLQVLLDSLTLKKKEGKPELSEDILWNHYYYEKYRYQTHIMIVVIALCILLNILGTFIDPTLFPAIAAIVLFFGTGYIGYTLWDLSLRDTQIFDEYDFGQHTGAHPRQNIFNSVKSIYDTDVDVSNCVVRKPSDSYKQL